MKKARVLHRKALKPEDADILCGVWWPSWSTCNKQQPTWQFPLNKLFYPASRHRCSIAEKSMDGFPKSSIEQSCKWDAMVTMKRARVLHRKALKPEDADILCGVWWPSWSTCNKQQPTWQFPLNKLFFTLQEEQSLCFLTAWQSIHLGQPRITFPSPFRVAGVGRSIITRF